MGDDAAAGRQALVGGEAARTPRGRLPVHGGARLHVAEVGRRPVVAGIGGPVADVQPVAAGRGEPQLGLERAFRHRVGQAPLGDRVDGVVRLDGAGGDANASDDLGRGGRRVERWSRHGPPTTRLPATRPTARAAAVGATTHGRREARRRPGRPAGEVRASSAMIGSMRSGIRSAGRIRTAVRTLEARSANVRQCVQPSTWASTAVATRPGRRSPSMRSEIAACARSQFTGPPPARRRQARGTGPAARGASGSSRCRRGCRARRRPPRRTGRRPRSAGTAPGGRA